LTISDPIYPIFAVFLRKSERFQAIAKQRFFLYKIYDVYFDFLMLFGVGHLEVKPLIMTARIRIILQYQIESLQLI